MASDATQLLEMHDTSSPRATGRWALLLRLICPKQVGEFAFFPVSSVLVQQQLMVLVQDAYHRHARPVPHRYAENPLCSDLLFAGSSIRWVDAERANVSCRLNCARRLSAVLTNRPGVIRACEAARIEDVAVFVRHIVRQVLVCQYQRSREGKEAEGLIVFPSDRSYRQRKGGEVRLIANGANQLCGSMHQLSPQHDRRTSSV